MAGWSQQYKLPCTLVRPRRNRSVSMERFSLLLLEFGEIYFEDYSCIYYPNASTESESIDRKQRGRLKVCSKSLIFDPLDHAYPMLKIALRDCSKIERRQQNSRTNSSFVVVCSQYTEMLEGNIIAPHKFIRNEMRCLFSLSYITAEEVLPQVKTLQTACRLHKAEHQRLVNSIVQERHSKVSFNVSWLEDLYEETVVEISGERVTPLVTNPGRIMLTSSRIYFQAYNNVEVEPVLKLQLSDLKYVTKRRYMLRQVGLECLCSSGECMFLVLPSPHARNWLYEAVLAQPRVRLNQDSLEQATLNWLRGDMTNYKYLMLLNFLSDRSFNDIMQYPVMPWVVADYTSSSLDLTNPATFRDLSKPIGALNEERLAFFKERYEQMRGTKFLYGTHYSAPGYVLYYLVRAAPEYLLCLQNGKFDQPNRLFHEIARTWENVNIDHADVKELIPEFYQPPGDFLLNLQAPGVGHVNPGEGVCSSGYTTQGLATTSALNPSHPPHSLTNTPSLPHTPSRSLSLSDSPTQPTHTPLRSLSLSTTPTLLHPPTHILSDTPTLDETLPNICCDEWVHIDMGPGSSPASSGSCKGSKCLVLKYIEKVHKEAVSAVSVSHDNKTYFSVSNDKTIKVHTLEDNQLLRSSNVSNLPLSSLAVLPGSTVVLIGSWDNNVYTYSTEYAAVVNAEYCHHSSVTSISWRHGTMATGSWDSTVKIWTLPYDPSCHKPEPAQLQSELDHDNEVSCIDLDSDALRVASGTVDGYVAVWSIADEEREYELQAHNDGVCALRFSPDGSRLCICGGDRIVRVLDPSAKLEIISKTAPEILYCVVWMDEHLVLGGESGDLHVWEAQTLREVSIHKAHSGPVTCLHLSEDGSVLVSGSKDKCVAVWLVSLKQSTS